MDVAFVLNGQCLLIYSNPKYLLFEKVLLFADEKYNQA